MNKSFWGGVVAIATLSCGLASAQTTLQTLTANNTSACPASGALPAHCKHAFGGQRDSRPQVATSVFDAPAGNVSDEDIHGYLHDGNKTKIFANFMLGFCTTGDYDSCHNNVVTGYDSNDEATVAAQLEDLRRRHIDGAILTWAGNGTSEDAAALKFQRYLNTHGCKGPQQCDPMYLIMYDGASMDYQVAPTGIPGTTGNGCGNRTGGAYEDCVIAHIRNDMCWMNGMHWGNNAYQKAGGRPVVMIFPNESVIAPGGPAPSWTDVWVHIDEWNRDLPRNCGKPPFNANNGVPLIVFEDTAGFKHAGSGGAYYWVKVAGTEPSTSQFVFPVSSPSTTETLQQFYESAREHPDKMAWGAAFKGFNSSRSAWGVNRILDQGCGQLWMSSLTESNRQSMGAGLGWLQLITWNDYNEGTEIESGIDNCYRVSAVIENKNLTWKLESSNPFASVTTVSHVEIYDSQDGQNLAMIDKVPAATIGTWNLSVLKPGKHTIYVRMVGKNSILNQISPGVTFTN